MIATTPPGVEVDATDDRLSFDLPPELEATEPPEARGLTRDAVRMLVATDDALTDSTFGEIPRFLDPGDLVVINTSATIPAAVDAVAADGTHLAVHLSTDLGGDRWGIEPRRLTATATDRWIGPLPPAPWLAAGDGTVTLVEPYLGSTRLWVAELALPQAALRWLAGHGRPIRYGYVPRPWSLSNYQNVYAAEPGSAEMPSAGRPFTPDVLMRLVAKGVGVTPLVLHTGVASLAAGELPYPERFRVPAATAARVNDTHRLGGRVVAVGTTVVRALESAAGDDGLVHPADGWTDLVITPRRGVRSVDGLLTGWHEPEASHLLMLEAVAGRPLVERSYQAGLAGKYRWHEFGDVHLLI